MHLFLNMIFFIIRGVLDKFLFWYCQVQSAMLIGKFDIFKQNRTQNVLTCYHHLCCLTRNGVWRKPLTMRLTHQFHVLIGQKDTELRQYVRVRIALMNNDAYSLIRFSNFGEEIVVYHSELTALHCWNETVATWPDLPKKQATICFEAIFPQTTGWSSRLTVFVSGSYA